MRVLLINAQWTGSSTGKIAYGFYKRLKESGHDAILAYGMGILNHDDKGIIKIAPRVEPKIHFRYNLITGYHGAFGPIANYRLKKIIESFKPDIVQLYNLHGYYMNIFKFMDYLAKKNIPTVYGMLDEYPYLGYCCYAYDCEQYENGCENCKFDFEERYMKSFFFNRARKTFLMKHKNYDSFSQIVFTGPEWVVKRAKKSLLLHDKDVRIVDEYVDTEETFIVRDTTKLRKELGISERTIIFLDVAPSGDKRKGVEYFIRLAERFEKKESNCIFINVGYENNFKKLPKNFMGIPFIKDQKKLAEYYALADLFVCTSMADTMPNSCLDALACGTPVCGFDISGIPYVAKEPLGKFVEPGNVDRLEEIIQKTDKKTDELLKACREYAVKRYSLTMYYSKQLEIYYGLLEK